MRNLSAPAIIEKNKLDSKNPYITLIELQYDDNMWLYLTNYPDIRKYYDVYNDNYVGDRSIIVYPYPAGTNYEYLPFVIDNYVENQQGELNNITISIDNTNRFMEAYLHHYTLVDRQVIIRVININLLHDTSAQLYDMFKIRKINSGIITSLTLGHAGSFSSTIGHLMSSNYCIYTFKDQYCKYNGPGTVCYKYLGDAATVGTCRYYNNSANFGACPSVRTMV